MIDLTTIAFIANSELVALAGMLRRLSHQDASVVIAGCDPRTREVLSMIGLVGLAFTNTVHGAATTPEQQPSANDVQPTAPTPSHAEAGPPRQDDLADRST